MQLPLLIVLLATSVLAAEVGIEITHHVECTRKSTAGDSISVDYRGTLPNGEEFDSSYGRQPIQFNLGVGAVIKGWDQGLLDMCIGEKRRLIIPGSLAYGASRGIGSCKTDCTLLFDTELMAIKGVKADEPVKEPATEPGKTPVTEPAKEPTPEHEEEKVSPRQSGLDHIILGFAGLLFVVSATLFFLRMRNRKRAGKGIFGGESYEIVDQRAH